MTAIKIFLYIVLPILFLFVILAFISIFYMNYRYQKFIFSQDNSIRSFIIDKKSETVKFFNRNNIRNVRTLTFEQFYVQFDDDAVLRLKAWFDSLLRKNSHPSEYFDINVYIDRSSRKYFSILKAVSINYDEKILHIDSYLFSTIDSRSRQVYNFKNQNLDEALKKFEIVPTNKGATIHFSFFPNNKISTKSEVDYLVYVRLKEIALFHTVPPQRYLLEVSPNEFVIFDFHTFDQNAVSIFVHRILDLMHRYLEINSLTDSVAIKIGIVKNSYFSHNARKLITVAREMADIARNKNLTIVTYDKNVLETVNEKGKYTSEIEHVIQDKKLNYTFSSVYDVKNEKVLGYLSHVELHNSSVKTLEELYARSIKTEETHKLLIAMVSESVLRFNEVNKDSSKILFKNLKFNDAERFAQIISKYQNLEVSPCFEEYDVSYYSSNYKDFFQKIDKMKEAGLFPCLKLSDHSLMLDNKIYASFDYFIIYLDETKLNKKEIGRVAFRVIVEKLLKFNKPIIVTRAHSWSTVELLVRSGIEYIAGDAISPNSRTLYSPTSKSILKIRRMME